MSDQVEKEKAEEIKLSEKDSDTNKSAPPAPVNETETTLFDCDADIKLDPRFEMKSTIGSGGMSTVFKVLDKSIDKVLALKVLHRELSLDNSAVKRFLQEAEAAGKLDHPNIVNMYESGQTEDGRPFILMDYIDGMNLAQLLEKEGPLPLDKAQTIFDQICQGLTVAHKSSIIHRDLKPSNIIISTESGQDKVFLVDFGIAKIQEGDIRKTQDLTQTGDVFGSPEYMSPEQCLNVQVDTRSDLYSLGCVMYKTITGKAPFSGSNPIQVIAKHLNDVPLSLNDQLDKKVQPEFESVVSTCLEKSPELRYKTIEELHQDILAVKAGNKPKVARRMSLARKSKPIFPIAASIIALISWMVLGASIWNYSDYNYKLYRSKNVITQANAVSKIFYDAGVAMGGYSITKSPLFSDRYDKIVRQLPEDLDKLAKIGGYSDIQKSSIENIQKFSKLGLKILGESKSAIDDNRVDVAQFRARHMYKEIRSLGSKLQDELRTLTKAEREYISNYEGKHPLSEIIFAGICCLLMNILCLISFLFYQRKKN